jgi:hypothetical protein
LRNRDLEMEGEEIYCDGGVAPPSRNSEPDVSILNHVRWSSRHCVYERVLVVVGYIYDNPKYHSFDNKRRFSRMIGWVNHGTSEDLQSPTSPPRCRVLKSGPWLLLDALSINIVTADGESALAAVRIIRTV